MATYYTLIGKVNFLPATPYEIIFGDYDLDVVQDEKYDLSDGGEWYGMKIISTGDGQAEIDACVAEHNRLSDKLSK